MVPTASRIYIYYNKISFSPGFDGQPFGSMEVNFTQRTLWRINETSRDPRLDEGIWSYLPQLGGRLHQICEKGEHLETFINELSSC